MKTSLERKLWRRLYDGQTAWQAGRIFIQRGEAMKMKEIRETLFRWWERGFYGYRKYLFSGWITRKGRELGPGGPRK